MPGGGDRQATRLWPAGVSLLVACGLVAYLFPQDLRDFLATSSAGAWPIAVALGFCLLSPFAGGVVGGWAVVFTTRRLGRSGNPNVPTVLGGVAIGVWIGLALLAAPVIVDWFNALLSDGMKHIQW